MVFLLKPGLFTSLKAAESQKLMRQDIKNNLGKELQFVAALNVKVGTGEKTSLFAVTDKPKEWQEALKGQKVMVGKCQIVKGPKTQIVIKSVVSGTFEAAAHLVELALKDRSFEGVNSEELERDRQKAEKIRKIVGDSYTKAQRKGKIDRGFDISDAQLQAFAKNSLRSTEFAKFNTGFRSLLAKYELAGVGIPGKPEQLPIDIWSALIDGLRKSGYIKGLYDATDDGYNILATTDEKHNKLIREKALEDGMKDLKVFVEHAQTYFVKVIEQVKKRGGTTWAFWSGFGAQAAALREQSSGVVLEGSIGKWFEDWWDFKGLTGGVHSILVWSTISELYAKTAAAYYESFKFHGYVGPGANRDQSVFNKIEQPMFIEVLKAKKRSVKPEIEWHVVTGEVKLNSQQDGWIFDTAGHPTVSVGNDRAKALSMLVKWEKELAAPVPKPATSTA
jgi:hypothetical protein